MGRVAQPGVAAHPREPSPADAGAPLHEQVTAWLFPTSVTAVMPVVAGLRDPTVRRRYVAAREVLAELSPLFEAAVADLGVTSAADRRRRADEVLAFLPRLMSTAERIMAVTRVRDR